ncbi:MAG: zinc ribbon domain-containing protein [Ruminococcus sp.]|nr:zinc ribbon domain-containing protein [Ruminococcus sp.]
MFCPNCGNQVPDNAKFCGGCGYRFPEAEAAVQEAVPQQAPVIPEPVREIIPDQPVQQAYEPVPQPMPQQPYPAATQSSDEKKGLGSVAIFLITFLILGIIMAAVILFVYPGVLMGKDDDSSSKSSKKSSSSVVVDDSEKDSSKDSDADVTTTTTTTTVTTSKPDETEPPETTTTEPKETEPVETETTEDILTPPVPADLSTYDRPTMNDFTWCVGQDGFLKAMPAGAEQMTSADEIDGGWKCFINYEMEDVGFGTMRELDNVDIQFTDSSSGVFTIDWYLMMDGDETMDESDTADSDFAASLSGGRLTAVGDEDSGDAVIYIEKFYRLDGKEYAYGFIDMGELPEDAGSYEIYVALVRP